MQYTSNIENLFLYLINQSNQKMLATTKSEELLQLLELIELINIGTDDIIKKILAGTTIEKRIEYAYQELVKHKDNSELKMFIIETTEYTMHQIARKLEVLGSSKRKEDEQRLLLQQQPAPIIYSMTAEKETKDLFMEAIKLSVLDLPLLSRMKLIQEAEQTEEERISRDREYAKQHGYKFVL